MAETVEAPSWSPDALLHPNRYWAGRHHPQILANIAHQLARSFGTQGFTAGTVEIAVLEVLGRLETVSLTKGTRWAYVKVLRDIGLVVARGHRTYYLTSWALELGSEVGYRELLVRALIRPFEEKNPAHGLLGFFTLDWPASPGEFVKSGRITAFERHSENSLWITNIKQTHVPGLGRNQFNQIWNGLLPFLQEIKLVWRFDSLGGGLAVRNLAPVWDWSEDYVSESIVLPQLKQFIRAAYGTGRMVTLPELSIDFWNVAKVSASTTLKCLESWSNEVPKEVRLVKAPGSIADQETEMNIVTEQGTFGAFVRRGA